MHLFFVIRREAADGNHVTGVFKLLKIEFVSAGNPFCSLYETFARVEAFYYSSPEFIFYGTGKQRSGEFLISIATLSTSPSETTSFKRSGKEPLVSSLTR